MSRDEMIKYINENPNVKITHSSFSDDEYIYQKNGNIYEENNYLFEDWYSDTHNGIRMRTGGSWENGWTLYNK